MTESTIPARVLESLQRLAGNLWWCWDADACRLFADIAPAAWRACGHNPVRLVEQIARGEVTADLEPARIDAIVERLDAYLAEPLAVALGDGTTISADHPIVYFCAEYGLHESLPLYSGGLGVLAGDHLKSASDLALPLVAVGLLYREGYLKQQLATGGEQTAAPLVVDPAALPMTPVCDEAGRRLEVVLGFPDGDVVLQAWRVAVGRVTLYLLDADVPANSDDYRAITRKLYGGDGETRIQQELILGFGGARLIRALGLEPSVCHMNEGHAAFLGVERAHRMVVQENRELEAARDRVRATTVFTTHTPVPAGHDRFDNALMQKYLSATAASLGLSWDDFMALGQTPEDAPGEDGEPADFNMTHLALHFSSFCNGVSVLHGQASRRLLHAAWPELAEQDVPIATITNGIHLPTWTAPAISAAVGAEHRPVLGTDFAERGESVPAAELWRIRRALKRDLIAHVRSAIRDAAERREDEPSIVDGMLAGLDGDPLLIGFARRFASYKRADLLMTDPERLAALLAAPDRPVRILIAGKAHPADEVGQKMLRSLFAASRRAPLLGLVYVVENYDMELAHHLVRGVDVWLNNPQRMKEASGTSGMKAAANGVLNLSISDGWWPEGADGHNGWTIAADRVEDDDAGDAEDLYRLLEDEVAPLFWERDADGMPAAWLQRVAHTLKTIPPRFDTQRMVEEYLEQAYRPLARAYFSHRR